MGEVGMAWRCLLSSRNDEQVSACTPRQKNDGGKSGAATEGRVRRRKDRARERGERASEQERRGERCRDGFSRDGESARARAREEQAQRIWYERLGAHRIRRKKKHRVNDPTRRAVARY